MTFVARFRSNVVACPITTDGRIVRVCSIDGDVSAGSEPRGIVPWDTQLGGPDKTKKIVPLWVIYHRVVWVPREIEWDARVAQICAGATAVE